MDIIIAPSILSANFAKLEEDIRRVENAGADWIHVDVMDGHFVPNITIGPCVIESIRKITKLPLDVHLMISTPQKYYQDFIHAGSDWLTFHQEAVDDQKSLLESIRKLDVKAGISIRPKTPVQTIFPLLDFVDLVLIMSVEPGFGGQKFQSHVISKATELRQQKNCPKYISMDGGISPETSAIAVEAGVNVLVSGSAIFKNPNPHHVISQMRTNSGC